MVLDGGISSGNVRVQVLMLTLYLFGPLLASDVARRSISRLAPAERKKALAQCGPGLGRVQGGITQGLACTCSARASLFRARIA